jgi:predicted DNA-binding transcriptional regulator AlpA
MQERDIPVDKLGPLMTLEEVCGFFGGSAPLHPATIYRGIGIRYPRPVKIGPNSNRWLRHECEAALRALAGERRLAPTFPAKRNDRPVNVDANSGIHRRGHPQQATKNHVVRGLERRRRSSGEMQRRVFRRHRTIRRKP